MSLKKPFERILSLVDRKKLFEKLISSGSTLVLKLSDQKILVFKPQRITLEGHLEGFVDEKALASARQKTVVAFFYSGKDRYFLNSKIIRSASGLWRLQNCTDFYRLNRRDTYRITVPSDLKLAFQVKSVAGLPVEIEVPILDFSVGGLRVQWNQSPLKAGTAFKGSLILKAKELPIQAVLKHRSRAGVLGLEFVNFDAVQLNRLRLLSIELQQLVNFKAKASTKA